MRTYAWTDGAAIEIVPPLVSRCARVYTGKRGRPAYLCAEVALYGMPACSRCGAGEGEACRVPTGNTRRPHRERRMAWARGLQEERWGW